MTNAPRRNPLSRRSKFALTLVASYALIALATLVEWPREASPTSVTEDDSAHEPSSQPIVPTTASAAPRPVRTLAGPKQQRTGATKPTSVSTSPEPAEVAMNNDSIETLVGAPPDPQLDDKLAEFERQWQSESDDPRWTEVERNSAAQLFAKLSVPEELLRDVRCRRSLCRITLDANDPLRLAGLASHVSESDSSIKFRMQDGEAFAYLQRDHATTASASEASSH